jgi:tetratricopeptide (TPR) repeat protein
MQKKLRDDCCGPSQARLAYLTTLTYLARYMEDYSNPEDALPLATQALDLARNWSREAPQDPLAERALAFSLSAAGDVLRDRGKGKDAVKLLAEARPLWEAQLKRSPGDLESGLYAAQTQGWTAAALNASEGPLAAVAASKQARAMFDSLLVLHPNDTRLRYERIRVVGNMATYLRTLASGDPKYQVESIEAAREAWALARENARLSPGDNDALDQAAVDATILGNRLIEQKKLNEAWSLFVQGGELIDQLLKIDPSDRRNQYLKASNLNSKGSLLAEQGRTAEEIPVMLEAEAIFRRILKTWPGDLRAQDGLVSALYVHAKTERMEGHPDSAKRLCQEALDVAADAYRRQKDDPQPIWGMGELRQEAAILHLEDPTLPIEKANHAGPTH